MQRFINNWSAVLAAPLTVSAVSLSVPLADAAKLIGLGSGDYYLLTLAEVNQAGQEVAWEVVKVTATADGALTVVRGIEGAARAWPVGAAVSGRVTAGTLASLRDAASQGDGGSGGAVVIGTGYPDSAPPSIGAHYFFETASFLAVGATQPEHWVQLSGYPNAAGDSVTFGYPVQPVVVGRMTRQASLDAYGTAASDLPAVPFMLPDWRAKVEGFKILLRPEVDGLVTKVTLDFGSNWSFIELFVAETPLFAPVRAGNVVSLSVSQCVRLNFVIDPYQDGDAWALYVEITAEPIGRLVPL